MPDELVPLCECWDIVEAQSLRASLEARGVPVHIDGEHQRAATGLLLAGVKLRAMVPRSQLELARRLAADLRPDLAPDDEDDAPPDVHTSPARRLPDGDSVEDDDEVVEEDGPLVRKKSLAAAVLLAFIGLAIGTLHIYAGEQQLGIALVIVAVFGVGLWIAGQPAGQMIVMLVWAIDIVRGFILLRRQNAALERQTN